MRITAFEFMLQSMDTFRNAIRIENHAGLRPLISRSLAALALFAALFLANSAAAQAEPTFVGAWGPSTNLLQPRDVSTGPDGSVLATDTGNHGIQKFNDSGVFQSKWGSQGNGNGQFNVPSGIEVTDSGNVYVAEQNNNRVQKSDSVGVFTNVWGTFGFDPGQFWGPTDVAVDGSGNSYVVDNGNQRVQKFDSSNLALVQWGGPGNGPGKFSNPNSIAVSPEGTVYVVDSGNNRIQTFNANGTFKGEWGEYGGKNGQFDTAGGIAIDSEGAVYVADTGNDRIQKFTSSGEFIEEWGTSGNGDGQFNSPKGVAIGKNGSVYVADTGNNRIERFNYPPDPPVVLKTDPASPNESLKPKVQGIAPPESTVSIFDGPDCVSNPVAVEKSEVFNGAGVEVTVAEGSTTTFAATVTDEFGLTSGCSKSSVTYTQAKKQAPPAPVNLTVVPTSPNSSLMPKVKGSAQAGTIVRIFTNSDCSGLPSAQGPAEVFGSTGLEVKIAAGSTTTFRATATGGDNLTSSCSSSSATYKQADSPDPNDGLKGFKSPTKVIATFDGKNLAVKVKCPVRFKPRCLTKAVPTTLKSNKGKPMARLASRKIRSNRYLTVRFNVKPVYRNKIEAMTKVDKKLLSIKQKIRSRKIRNKKNRRTVTVFHTYKVRTKI